jgi:type II secretory pathway pseudopilin PulG
MVQRSARPSTGAGATRRVRDEAGFGLIDTLAAMLVLGLVLVFSLPAVLVAQSAVRRADELDLLRSGAQGALEEIRALDFADVGTTTGSPAGVVVDDRIVVVDGVQVRLQTEVRWEGIVSGLAMVDQDGDGTPTSVTGSRASATRASTTSR